MHIAVFDDNIADRKHLERLLGRSSDRYQKEGKEHFYIDSYGNIEALLRFPQMYDIIFIDKTSLETEDTHFRNGLDVAKILFEAGGIKNIVMCSSKYDYEVMAKEEGMYDQMLYLKKDIKQGDLDNVLTECETRIGNPVPKLELRGETETIYAEEMDIIYAKANGPFKVDVFLTEDRSISLISDIYNLYEQCEIFRYICPVSQTSMINVKHVVKESFTSVVMDNGAKVNVSPLYKVNIKTVKKRIEEDEMR
jgi:DNA-binding LytR/AlgR family response regulator